MELDEFTAACTRLTDDHPLIVAPPGWTVFRLSAIGNNPTMQHLTPIQVREGAAWDFLLGARMGAVLTAMLVDGYDGYMLTVVHRDHPARVLARHFHGGWENINLDQAPWLTLSTAGALRAYFIDGTRAPVKNATDPRLFHSVFQPPPPVDQEGRI